MNVILIHGSYGKPFENWFPWLEENLTRAEIECFIPTFPTPNHQNYNDWSRLLDYYYDMGMLNEGTILIGHSCGAVCAAKYLEDRNYSIRGLITVSGYNNYVGADNHINELNSTFYEKEEKLKNVSSLVNKRYSFISDNDPFITQEALHNFAEIIDSELIIVSEAGHFNSSAGYDKFPDIMRILSSFD